MSCCEGRPSGPGIPGGVVVARCTGNPTAEALRLIDSLPGRPLSVRPGEIDCAVLEWARCGAMTLTGFPGAAPVGPAEPVAIRIAGALAALESSSAELGSAVRIDLRRLLSWRAELNQWRRGGAASVNGTCRLIRAADGWLAVNLARPEDEQLVGLLHGDSWEDAMRDAPAGPTVEVLGELGVPVAKLGSASGPPWTVTEIGGSRLLAGRDGYGHLIVADLSAMWAGPLCANILARIGLDVIKVEDPRRPDGARRGSPAFYEWLHPAQRHAAVDFQRAGELRSLLETADVVIESSRPRALRQLGIAAEDWLCAKPGRIWVSITGYGRGSNRAAFGDDAAVAGGLVAWQGSQPVFCADAIADPVTGVYAALAAASSLRAGGGHLIDLSLADVAADVARPGTGPAIAHDVCPDALHWAVSHGPDAVSC